MTAILLRRPGWGVDLGKVCNLVSGKIKSMKHIRAKDVEGCTHIIQWGMGGVKIPDVPVINTTDAIKKVSNKSGFRRTMMDHYAETGEQLCPFTYFNTQFAEDFDDVNVIVRPRNHKQGEDLYHCETMEDVRDAARKCGKGYYISDYIPKVDEYRVYIVAGKIFALSKKVVEDRDAIAWNHAGGECEFVNVRWDDWPIAVANVATNAFALSGLDFGGVDVMVDADGEAYVLEINSAISLPMLEDGDCFIDRISYHQKAMIKCLEWLVEGKDADYAPLYKGKKENSYHQYIHAAMKEKK